MLNRLKPALALATLPLGLSAAHASDCIYGAGNQCYPTFVQVDPITGRPASGAADQAGTNATDGQAASANQQHGIAYEYVWNPVTTSWDRARGLAGVRYAITPDVRTVATLDATKTSGAGSFTDIPLNDAATVGLNFQGLAASGATVSYFITNSATGTPSSTISSLNAATGVSSPTRTTDGDARIAVGGHAILRIQVTTAGTGTITVASNVSAAGSIVDLRGPIPPGTNAIGSVIANQGGAPWAVSWTNQTVGITGTVQLGAGSAAIGSVSVSNFPTTQQVSGTVAATEADGANVTLGAKADAAAGTGNGSVIAQLKQLHLDSIGPSFGTYNSTAPTLANGAVGSLQLDASGQLKAVVNPAAGSTWSTVDGNLVQTINAAGSTTTKAVSTQRADGKALLTAGETVIAAQGGAPWSTTDTNAANTITAPGTLPSKVQGVQGTTNGTPVNIIYPDTRSSGSLSLTAAGNVLNIPVPQGAASFSFTTSGISGSGASVNVNTGSDSTVLAPAIRTNVQGQPNFQPLQGDGGQSNQISVSGQQFVQFVVSSAGTGSATINYTISAASPRPYIGVGATALIGGVNQFSRIPSSAANTNLTQAKGSPGRVYKIVACNTTTTPYRLKLFNATAANVTVGTTAPLFSRPLPAAAASGGLNCATYDMADLGWYFSTAISYAIVAGATDSDATAPGTGAITDISVEWQ